MTMALAESGSAFPVRVSMQYPERVSRLTSAFRIILFLPVAFFAYLVSVGYVIFAIWAAIVVRGRIPRWLFDFQVGVHRYTYRAWAYFALLTDRYPPFEGPWDLEYEVDYPERVSRWRLVFWKLITSLPHFVILSFLAVAALFVVFIGWFAILFTGRFPRGLHSFVLGVTRWGARVSAYVESLTDAYPPYSLDADAATASRSAVVGSAVLGTIGTAIIVLIAIVAGVAIYAAAHKTKTVDVRYAEAVAGSLLVRDASRELDNVLFTLERIDDRAEVDVISARAGHRLVEVDAAMQDERVFRADRQLRVYEDDMVRLTTTRGGISPALIVVDGVPLPDRFGPGRHTLRAFFEVPTEDRVTEARFYPGNFGSRHVRWRFE